jgi:hypothetical protein
MRLMHKVCFRKKRQFFVEIIHSYFVLCMLHLMKNRVVLVTSINWLPASLTWYAPGRFYFKSLRVYNPLSLSFPPGHPLCWDSAATHKREAWSAQRFLPTSSKALLNSPDVIPLGTNRPLLELTEPQLFSHRKKKQHIPKFFLPVRKDQPE